MHIYICCILFVNVCVCVFAVFGRLRDRCLRAQVCVYVENIYDF